MGRKDIRTHGHKDIRTPTVMSKPKVVLKKNLSGSGTSIAVPTSGGLSPDSREIVRKILPTTALDPALLVPIEEAIHRKTLADLSHLYKDENARAYRTIYLSIARHIIANLKPNNSINNTELIRRVNARELDADTLVNLSPEDMHRERWQSLVDKKKHDLEVSVKDPEATTTLYWCSRCGRNKCTFFQRQDRSADEAMTIHVTCCYCGRKWKH
jgi:DNA-directed RNA polymerase subunit M/transcription elongation factor TFIIS